MDTLNLLYHTDLRQAVYAVEARLPEDVRAALADVKVMITPAGFKDYADAGDRTIRLRADLHGSMDAIVAIVAHEVCHEYLNHAAQWRAGLKSEEQIEAEADAMVQALGFDLAHRRLFYGR